MKTTFREIDLDAIDPDPGQPRLLHDDDIATDTEPGLVELAASIKTRGVMEPIILRPAEHGRYHIVAGERRWRASRMAGRTTIPALVSTDPSLSEETTRFAVQIEENLQRKALSLLELGAAAEKLIATLGITANEVAAMLHTSPSTVSRWRTALDPQHADRLAAVRGNVAVLEVFRGLPRSSEAVLLELYRTTGRMYSQPELRRVAALGAGAPRAEIEAALAAPRLQSSERPAPPPPPPSSSTKAGAAALAASDLDEDFVSAHLRTGAYAQRRLPGVGIAPGSPSVTESDMSSLTAPPMRSVEPDTVRIEQLELPAARGREILTALGRDGDVPGMLLTTALIAALRGA